jgi:photosystem P840 reaction center protein PscD
LSGQGYAVRASRPKRLQPEALQSTWLFLFTRTVVISTQGEVQTPSTLTFQAMPITKSGNAVHKLDKYFITQARRDENGRLKLTIASAAGYGRLTNTEEIKRKLADKQIQLVVLSSNEDIKYPIDDWVKLNEERYNMNYDGRGVQWTVREIQVFVNPNNNEMSVEINGKVIPLDEFFK